MSDIILKITWINVGAIFPLRISLARHNYTLQGCAFIILFLVSLSSLAQKPIQIGGKEDDYIGMSYIDSADNFIFMGQSKNSAYIDPKDSQKTGFTFQIKKGYEYWRNEFYFVTKINPKGQIIWKTILSADIYNDPAPDNRINSRLGSDKRFVKLNDSELLVILISNSSYIRIQTKTQDTIFMSFKKGSPCSNPDQYIKNMKLIKLNLNDGSYKQLSHWYNGCNSVGITDIVYQNKLLYLYAGQGYYHYINDSIVNYPSFLTTKIFLMNQNINIIDSIKCLNIGFHNKLSNEYFMSNNKQFLIGYYKEYYDSSFVIDGKYYKFRNQPIGSNFYYTPSLNLVTKKWDTMFVNDSKKYFSISQKSHFNGSNILSYYKRDTKEYKNYPSYPVYDSLKIYNNYIYPKDDNYYTNIYNIKENKKLRKYTPLHFQRGTKPFENRMNAQVLPSNTKDQFLLYTMLIDTFNRNDVYFTVDSQKVKTSEYSSFLVSYDSSTLTPKKIYPLFNNNTTNYTVKNIMQSSDSNLWMACNVRNQYNFLPNNTCAKDTIAPRGGYDIFLINITKLKIITGIKEDKKAVSAQDVDGSSILSYNVYPNPTIQNINLQYILKENAEVEIVLYSMRGHKLSVLKEKTKMTSGAYLEQFNLDKDLASGMYLVKIKAGKETLTKRVSVVK
jgi:flagellin-like hook-associated protein FlgL